MLSDELLDEVFLALGGEQDRLGLEEGVVGPPILGGVLLLHAAAQRARNLLGGALSGQLFEDKAVRRVRHAERTVREDLLGREEVWIGTRLAQLRGLIEVKER